MRNIELTRSGLSAEAESCKKYAHIVAPMKAYIPKGYVKVALESANYRDVVALKCLFDPFTDEAYMSEEDYYKIYLPNCDDWNSSRSQSNR